MVFKIGDKLYWVWACERCQRLGRRCEKDPKKGTGCVGCGGSPCNAGGHSEFYVLVHHRVEAETVSPTPSVPRKSHLDYEHLWQASVAAQGSFGGFFVGIHIPKWDKAYKAS